MIINKIKCFFYGHKLSYAEYLSPFATYAPCTASLSMDGSIEISKPFKTGFMHLGLVAKCSCCGCVVDAENLSLPILEPEL